VLTSCMLMINDEAQKRYGIFYDMPIGIELKIGKNWLDSEVILEV